MTDSIITVEHLSKRYFIEQKLGDHGYKNYTALRDIVGYKLRNVTRKMVDRRRQQAAPRRQIEEFWALKDVSFEVKEGSVVGIIGRNGAGKSTLLKILSRITDPSAGRVLLRGRVGSLLEVGTGFHPELTGRENIFLNGAILGMTRREISRKFDEIVTFAEVERFLDTPVKRYSSGMYVRLAFAVAAHLEPDILVVDEVLAVGDAEFQQKCLGKIDAVSRSEGRTILLVSHNMSVIDRLCPTSIWLDRGGVRQYGSSEQVIRDYLSNVPNLNDRIVEFDKIRRPYYGGDDLRLVSIEWLCELPLRQGEEVQARVLFEARSPVQNVAVGICFCDLGGRNILSYDTDFTEPYRPNLPRAGVYAIEFTTDALPLDPNTYSLEILLCVRDGVGSNFDFITSAVQLDVLAGPKTPDFLSQYRNPQVHLDGKWRWTPSPRVLDGV
jgi:lipopolysaccharide transport system ATP-binding protein